MRNVNPPSLAEVIHLQDHAPRSLETAAASINRHIDLFTRAARSCQAHRVRAGHELIAVRKRIPEGDGKPGAPTTSSAAWATSAR